MTYLTTALIVSNQTIMSNLILDPFVGFKMLAAQADSLLSDYGGVKMIVAPEYFLNRRGFVDTPVENNKNVPAPVSKKVKHKTYDKLVEVSAGLGNTIIVAGTIFYTKGVWNKVGLNVCPILKNGQIIYKYYKMYDDGALNLQDSEAQFKTKNTRPVFTSDGITFAVEVCGDMGNHATEQRNWPVEQTVNVHMVIAQGAGILPSHVHAGAGGLVIYTDLSDGRSFVRQSATGNWRRPNIDYNILQPVKTANHTATGARIDIYRAAV